MKNGEEIAAAGTLSGDVLRRAASNFFRPLFVLLHSYCDSPRQQQFFRGIRLYFMKPVRNDNRDFSNDPYIEWEDPSYEKESDSGQCKSLKRMVLRKNLRGSAAPSKICTARLSEQSLHAQCEALRILPVTRSYPANWLHAVTPGLIVESDKTILEIENYVLRASAQNITS